MTNFFPTYLAREKAFCNRTLELARLKHNMRTSTPTLLISPRRYGKTSLILKAIDQEKLPFAYVDLYKAFSEEEVIHYILTGVGQLLGKIEPTPKKLLSLAGDLFSKIHIRVALHQTDLSLEFGKEKKVSIDLLLQTFEKLDEIGKKQKKKLIFFLDEFQMVGEVSKNYAIEAVLREVAQKAKSLIFIFCGSNRHLMEHMFSDKKRPFYKLCDQINLERISFSDYEKYIQHAAQINWKEKLEPDALEMILKLTERHPYYVNKLCSILWQDKHPPAQEKVEKTWLHYMRENKSITERELSLLSLNQRRLLVFMAEDEGIKNIFSTEFTSNASMSLGTIQSALKGLIRLDYVFKDQTGAYHILDPLLKGILQL